ncbi:MAG: sigma-70 family RNA polymerase sigma factor [Planctomycetales bacterium]|nr:sigma-70 family RNA polymerase sigma factor [Planctomycetales bacterium]
MTHIESTQNDSPLEEPSDETVRAAVAGDVDALGELLRAHQPAISIRVARALQVHPFADFGVDDVMQEVFLDAFQGIGQLRQETSAAFTVWINRVADRRLISMLRFRTRPKRYAKRNRPAVANVRPDDSDRIPQIIGVDIPDGKTRSPSTAAHEADIKRIIRAEFARLPREQQRALRWIFLERRSLRVTSQRMQKSPERIRTLVRKAKRSLRAALGAPGRWFS